MKKTKTLFICVTVVLISCIMAACAPLNCISDLFGGELSPDVIPHLILEEEKESAPVRHIDGDTVEEAVISGTGDLEVDAMYSAVTSGLRPVFSGDTVAKSVYDKAKSVLDRFILNDFTQYQRIHAIHDWLTYYIEYDFELYQKYLNNEQGITKSDKSFRLEGVFLDGIAVCDGISRAFNFLCGIEGIRAVQITGTFIAGGDGAQPHAWNKVKADNTWYNVDATMDRLHYQVDGKDRKNMIHHGFFMISDSSIRNNIYGRHQASEDNIVNYDCRVDYDVFKDFTAKIGEEEFAIQISDKDQLLSLFKAIKKAKRKVGKIEFQLKFDNVDSSKLNNYDKVLREAYAEVNNKDFAFDDAKESKPYFQYPNGVIAALIYA